MAKVLCIGDFRLYAEMIALLLEQQGPHEVEVEIVPFDLDVIERFKPDVLIVNLARKIEAVGAPLQDFYTEVDGAKTLKALQTNPSLQQYPLLITAIAVEERELPRGFRYLAFLEVPSKFDYLLETIDRIAASRGHGLARE